MFLEPQHPEPDALSAFQVLVTVRPSRGSWFGQLTLVLVWRSQSTQSNSEDGWPCDAWSVSPRNQPGGTPPDPTAQGFKQPDPGTLSNRKLLCESGWRNWPGFLARSSAHSVWELDGPRSAVEKSSRIIFTNGLSDPWRGGGVCRPQLLKGDKMQTIGLGGSSMAPSHGIFPLFFSFWGCQNETDLWVCVRRRFGKA